MFYTATNTTVVISSILTVYIYISGNGIISNDEQGSVGRKGCRVPKVRWCGRLECRSLKERVCSANHMERINSGFLCVVTGIGGRRLRDSFVLACVR